MFHLFSLPLLLRLILDTDKQIGEYGSKTARGDARREDAAHLFRESVENLGHELHAQSAGKADGNDENLLAAEFLGCYHFDAGCRHRAEHEQRGAAEHRFGHQREHEADGGEDAQDDEHGRDEISHVARCNARELYHTVVLCEDGVGEGVECRREQRRNAVCHYAARGALHENIALHRFARNHGVCRNVAVCLNGCDDEDDAQRDECREVEVYAIFKRYREVYAAEALHGLEIDVAEHPRHYVAHGETYHYGTHAQIAVAAAVEEYDDDEHEHGESQIVERTETTVCHRRIASAAGRDAHLDEAEADERHYDARYEGSDDAAGIAQHAAHEHFHHACRHARTEYHSESAAHSGCYDGADERIACALDTEQSGAHGSELAALDECGNARGEERHRHEETCGLDVEPKLRGYDKRWGHYRHEDGEKMLQGCKHSLDEWRTVVESVDYSFFLCGFHL